MVEQTLKEVIPFKPSATIGSSVTLDFEGTVPLGYVLSGLEVSVAIKSVTTAPNPATNRIHKLFKTIKVRNETGYVGEIRNSEALPMACLVSQALKETELYETTPRSTDCVRNPAIAAAATAYFGNYKLHVPMPGRSMQVSLELNDPATAIPGITAINASYAVTFIYSKTLAGQQLYIMTADKQQVVNARYNKVARGAIFAADSFSDDAESVVFGKDLSASVLRLEQNNFNDQLRGLADGNTTTGDTDVNTVDDPATGAVVYGVIRKNEKATGPVSLAMKQQESVGFILFAIGGTTSDLVNQPGA